MSLLKADQIRRNLFVTYSKQIAEIIGENEDGDPILPPESAAEEEENRERKKVVHQPSAAELSKHFRTSYARQHLLRQRALRLPSNDTGDKGGADSSFSSSLVSMTTTDSLAFGEERGEKTDEDEECWRVAYKEPYPSVRRMMRRVQDESLRTLIREAQVPMVPCRGNDYAAQRMDILHKIDEQIGRERIILLARHQKMDGKLHSMER